MTRFSDHVLICTSEANAKILDVFLSRNGYGSENFRKDPGTMQWFSDLSLSPGDARRISAILPTTARRVVASIDPQALNRPTALQQLVAAQAQVEE